MNKDFNTYYFAFGSNMNVERVKERKVNFIQRIPASIKDYKLVFDKKASGKPGNTFANIQPQDNSVVEGALYLIDQESLKKLDVVEGVPVHYLRKEIEVNTNTGEKVKAWVYVANGDLLASGKPSRDYLGHLLAGSDLLSNDYYEQLFKVSTLG